jgi:hypothetical protein
LSKGGVEAVLTGGSAATVYAPTAYQSRDLDFVVQFRAPEGNPNAILESLGYRVARDHYEHAENALIVEFPRGPLTVGRDLIRRWDTLREGDMLLHIIKPTDSCRDRLAGFLFWNDRGALEQAVAVARACGASIDIIAVRRWCESEGKRDAFDEFQRMVRLA